MRRYIDILNESPDVDLQAHYESLIRFAFEKIGLTINYNNYSVAIDEDSMLASVVLEDQEVPLTQLARLSETGLGHDYVIRQSSNALEIAFTADRALLTAQRP